MLFLIKSLMYINIFRWKTDNPRTALNSPLIIFPGAESMIELRKQANTELRRRFISVLPRSRLHNPPVVSLYRNLVRHRLLAEIPSQRICLHFWPTLSEEVSISVLSWGPVWTLSCKPSWHFHACLLQEQHCHPPSAISVSSKEPLLSPSLGLFRLLSQDALDWVVLRWQIYFSQG